MPLPAPIIEVLLAFRPLFTAPTWGKLMTLFTGTLLARGRRTVTVALRYTGHDQAANWRSFHQVLNRARWSPLAVSRQLLLLIAETFVPAGASVDLVIDETLERRWGSQISKRGHYRDSALSSRERSVSSPGLRWIVMAVVVPVPWTKQRWALPFLCVLATTPEVSERLGQRHKTIGRRARAAGWLGPSLAAHPLHQADGGYRLQCAGIGPLGPAPAGYSDYDRPIGCRVPYASSRAHSADHRASPRRWPALAFSGTGAPERGNGLANAHSGVVRAMRSGRWSAAQEPRSGYRTGYAPLPIRWVLTRDPAGRRPPKALFCTDPTAEADQIIRDFMKRWSLEVTFEEGRAHLGIETQRQWSDLAIERSTPLALRPLQCGGPLWAGGASGWADTAHTSGLVSQAERHLL